MSFALAADTAVVCTFANVRDEAYVQQITSSAIRAFMAARADRIVSSSPSVLDRLRSGGAGQPGQIRFDMTQGRAAASMSLSLSGLRNGAARNGRASGLSRQGADLRAMSSGATRPGQYSDDHSPGYQRGGPISDFGVESFIWTRAELEADALGAFRRERTAERADAEQANGLGAQGSSAALRDGTSGFDLWISASWSSARDQRAG